MSSEEIRVPDGIDSRPPASETATEPNIPQNQTMRSRVGLCVLALLCLHSSVCGQNAEMVHTGVLVFCDDPTVEKAVSSAVHKFNEKLTTGHKLALYQILTASKSESQPHSVYSLQFTTRRTDCAAGSNKTWTDCDYLPYGHRRPISCNATVQMTETEADTTQVDCHIEGHITPEKAHCLGALRKLMRTQMTLKRLLVSQFPSTTLQWVGLSCSPFTTSAMPPDR
ncbi:hypothetical protein Q5P01_015657 [Channa striata]|uniref:Cystatin kininogen-type domain-containing protein n=1 Tax=Channa striata TaxID=64152 RepID=A0AA88MCP0_CHASR|nr:hypothetical protein Q5P01_015657 [Channa striata]